MELILVTQERLQPEAASEAVRRDEAGGVALFLGIVRNHNLGRAVDHLEYDAYPPMAEKVMAEIRERAISRFHLSEALVHHRTGSLQVGEASLLVATSSAHRAEAFEACAWIVDQVKALVPVWKKEVWEGGESWIEGTPVQPPVTQA
jgi:molybdopterin synthase catalytic subunit